jgi:hypothetical protein
MEVSGLAAAQRLPDLLLVTGLEERPAAVVWLRVCASIRRSEQ